MNGSYTENTVGESKLFSTYYCNQNYFNFEWQVHFDIQVKKVTNLKDVNGSSVFISWRRGTKKNAGDTRRVLVAKNEATWTDAEHLAFDSKLFMDPKSQKFDEKTLSLTLKEV